MLRWIAALTAASLIAALLGFTGILTVSAGIAQFLCVVFLVMLGLSLAVALVFVV
jgi:uncharacterized membrane protein YtjA (UPF0391 family)